MKTLIITPAYSHVDRRTQEAVQLSGLPWLPLYEHSDLIRVRSILLSAALEKGAEVVVLLDADTVPQGGVIQRLVDQVTPARAMFGIYRLRGGTRLSVEVKDPAAAIQAVEARTPFPITWGGLGLAAVHGESLSRVSKLLPTVHENGTSWQPFCQPFVRDGAWYGDDRSFCDRLSLTGTDLVADPALDVRHAVLSMLDGTC